MLSSHDINLLTSRKSSRKSSSPKSQTVPSGFTKTLNNSQAFSQDLSCPNVCVETPASSEPTFILISIRQSCRCVSTFSKDHCTGDPDLTALCLGGADIMSKCQYECVYYRLFRGGWQWLCEVELDDVGSQITSPRLTERWKRDKTSSVLTLCPAAALVNPPH